MCVCTIVTSSIGLPVRSAEMSGSRGFDDNVLDVSPSEKRTGGGKHTEKCKFVM